jgi:D-alanine-D-alanine ligase
MPLLPLPLKIAVLHYQPAGEPADLVVGHIVDALGELGHQTVTVPVHDRVFDILSAIEASRCDLVFNVCETFADDYRMEVNVAALMEMAQVRYTGSGMAGLLLAQDKVVTKQLLGYHEVPTPNYATFDGETFETHGQLRFPLIVKPARTDASIGITGHSVVGEWDELTRRVREIRKELSDEALAEEFIEGREVYVGVLGGHTQRPEILPIVELDWGNWDPSKPQVSDREVKFGPETEGSPRLKIPRDIPEEVRVRIERSALLAFRVLKLRDYARIDLRLCASTGEVYVLEANPNPYLEKASELAMAAAERGIGYTQLIGRIVESAAARYKLPRKAPAAPPATTEPAAGATLPAAVTGSDDASLAEQPSSRQPEEPSAEAAPPRPRRASGTR